MATHPIERILHPKNSLDVGNENFEKNYYTSVRKAINNIECPVKEKHIRRIIIGTFQTKSGYIFWKYAKDLQLSDNPIVCWKFCHVLHKLLRDGHHKVIKDSYHSRLRLLDLGKMWGFLKQGYGNLIQNYCSLLVNKMDFHMRNPRFPGNLIITNEELDSIGENEVSIFFQLCCEIFDYMDEILCLQNSVMNSIDPSYSNSMTLAGQCRIAPLIMCIQDSSQLYDFTVRILFKLHSALPPSTLEGHRDRFFNQFKLLKKFYNTSRHFQYFMSLIQIPNLPDEIPNFFVQSDLKTHIKPVVVVSQEEIVDAEEQFFTFDDDSDKTDGVSLWSYPEENKITQQNAIIEKDQIIEKLMSRIQEMEMEIRQIKADDNKKIEELKHIIAELECATGQRMEREIEMLKLELEKQKVNTESETEVAKVTEKFCKMKEFYNKLRNEHIELIRNKAECDKQLKEALQTIDELKTTKETMEYQLKDSVRKEAELSCTTMKYADLETQLNKMRSELNQFKMNYEILQKSNDNFKDKLASSENQISKLEQDIMVLNKNHDQNVKDYIKTFIVNLVNDSLKISKRIMDEELELGFASVNCSPQYFCSQVQILIAKFSSYEESILSKNYSLDLFSVAFHYYYQVFYTINCSKTTIQNIPNLVQSNELLAKCVQFISHNFTLGEKLRNDFNEIDPAVEQIKKTLKEMYSLTETIIPEFLSTKHSDLETLLNKEMEQMDHAIQSAVLKIEQMIEASNKQQTGIKLEVNGKILSACTSLMQAIKQLIYDAKLLQMEIATKEKGTSSMKEFYQRNHRWTEGLISAAKTVAADANLLVECADKLIGGTGKFEELMAASQEIAASCAQLVVSSRVKADSSSSNLAKLSKSSKLVLQETGNVIATTKHCNKLIDESDVNVDLSKLSLHQAKRLEMECQVKVLELESSLEKERMRLASLRRAHYHLSESLSNDHNTN